jgi:predicted PurR-regulated permease PerM
MDRDFKRRTTFVVAICAGVAGAALLAWTTRVILLLLFAGLIGALLLTIMASWIEKWLKLRRSLALSTVVACFAIFIGLGTWMRGTAIVQQFSDLQVDLPAAVHQVFARLEAQSWGRWLLSRYADWDQLSSGLSYLLTRIGGAVATTASTFVGLFVVLAVSIYVAAEPGSYIRILHSVTPLAHRKKLGLCLASATQLLRSWLFAKAISMLSIGVFIALGLWALRVPLAGTLGFIAALLTFVPNLGPVISVVPAALLAFAISPTKGILTMLLFGIAHFLEGNIVTPLLERKIVTLPPALTLAVQLLLASVTGAIGIVLAAPLTAAILGILLVIHPSDSHSSSTSTQA